MNNPVYGNGTISAANIICTGDMVCNTITCPDVKYNDGLNSLVTSLSDINGIIETLAPLNSANTITAGTLEATLNVTSPALHVNGNATVTGDILYGLMGTNLTTQMTTINDYKKNGTISGTSTYQTIYTVVQGTRGFITVIAVAPNYNMFMGFFEWTAGGSYQSLTQLAQSGNAPQSVLSTTNASSGGTMSLTVQQVSNTGPIQARVTTAGTINWYVTLI